MGPSEAILFSFGNSGCGFLVVFFGNGFAFLVFWKCFFLGSLRFSGVISFALTILGFLGHMVYLSKLLDGKTPAKVECAADCCPIPNQLRF